MTKKEMRLKMIDNLNEKLFQRYESIVIGSTICFLLKDKTVCRLDSIGDEYNALVIEYADNIDMARKGVFGEDGELFCMDDMSEEQMLEAIIKEIEQA